MRTIYRSIGRGSSSAAYALTERDLREILAGHFGFKPESIDLGGLEIPSGEFHVSGMDPDPERGQDPSPRP